MEKRWKVKPLPSRKIFWLQSCLWLKLWYLKIHHIWFPISNRREKRKKEREKDRRKKKGGNKKARKGKVKKREKKQIGVRVVGDPGKVVSWWWEEMDAPDHMTMPTNQQSGSSCPDCSKCTTVNVLTLNQLLRLVSDPVRSWWLWPSSQSMVPVAANWGQQMECSPFSRATFTRPVWPTVVISLAVTGIQHHEPSH